MLLMMAKFLSAGMAAGLATGLGAAAYILAGASWTTALAVAWITMTGCALALIPLVAWAFIQFDVARDRPP